MGSNTFFVFDLDGTLADCAHRRHFLEQSPADWHSFNAGCVNDSPIKPIIKVMESLIDHGHAIEIWSGRSDEFRDQTVDWLWNNGLNGPGLILKMRKAGDHRPDTALKAEWLEQAERKPDFVFEDRSCLVAMYRAAGVPCAQVAEGDF